MNAIRPPEGNVLTGRQLNRSLLARQFLLQRQHLPVAEVIAHLAGMQSQVPKDPFIGLWSRIEQFDHGELDRLMLDRETVRLTLMRGTIHLATADDACLLRPMMQTMLEKYYKGSAVFAPNLAGLDLDEIIETGRQLLDETPMTGKALGERLGERWPDRDKASLAYAVRFNLPLVQVTPRGVWRKSHQATLTTIQGWLGKPVPAHRAPDEAIPRYLAAFGPATVADIQAWSGLPGLREAVDRLRPRLVTYRDERKRELFDVPDAPFPDPETPAPVRFLPGFENALLSHADRTRIVDEVHRKAIWRPNGLFPPTFLVDGFVRGTWKATRTKSGAEIDITPFDMPLTPAQRIEVEGEGLRLLAFIEDKANTFDIRFNTPT